MHIHLFEDEFVPRLYPVTIGRPAFAVTCGTYRLYDLVRQLALPVRCLVRPHLRDVVDLDFPSSAAAGSAANGAKLAVNARLVPSIDALNHLGMLAARGEPAIVRSGEAVAAAVLPADSFDPGAEPVLLLDALSRLAAPQLPIELPLVDYPHDILRHHLAIFSSTLEHLLRGGQYRQQDDGVFLAPGAKLGPYVVSDASAGPIVLEAGASVGPHSFLRGPIRLGARCRVIEHAAIKDHVHLGQTTKIGGEVEASIIEPYTNKQHHGFLGHSYLGSWINLGAGTCNSDLKNTYGTVKMEYGSQRIDTAMQFIGCIAGDYAKTAINTGIFTGKTIGVGSMVYGFVTTNVPSFVNYARLFGQVTEMPPEVLIATQARMFARRDVPQRACDIDLIHAMYELTRHERQLAGEPLSL
jgi:UDP-N-acetylglucosamine diphosphorylase / glucose-1-phosphate thymidylyltransferase / UDP-N-acetylgalactosamine diphosphorylase / glucosamine-1-phosphate N-acetyltransferase / galactosamine-1-phosphate N-acetyltransferase